MGGASEKHITRYQPKLGGRPCQPHTAQGEQESPDNVVTDQGDGDDDTFLITINGKRKKKKNIPVKCFILSGILANGSETDDCVKNTAWALKPSHCQLYVAAHLGSDG